MRAVDQRKKSEDPRATSSDAGGKPRSKRTVLLPRGSNGPFLVCCNALETFSGPKSYAKTKHSHADFREDPDRQDHHPRGGEL
eukprot:4742581-Pyramimonas_sp.AAC.1